MNPRTRLFICVIVLCVVTIPALVAFASAAGPSPAQAALLPVGSEAFQSNQPNQPEEFKAYVPVAIGKPPVSILPGTIVYQDAGVGGVMDLFVIQPDGSGKTNLTNSAADESWPRWSPDRTKIAYQRYDGNWGELYVMNADGGNPQLIATPGLTLLDAPEWSPDGVLIAFAAREYNGFERDIYVIGVDGSGLTNLTTAVPYPATLPAWSPDGTRIAFRVEKPQVDLMVINADGTNPADLTNDDRYELTSDWSPDGTKILFMLESGVDIGLHVMPATGGPSTRIIPQGQFGRWSADGTQIVYTGGNGGIFIANADGSGQTPVDPLPEVGMPDW